METRLKYLLYSKFAPATGVPLAESSASGDRHVSIVLGPRAGYETLLHSDGNIHIFFLRFWPDS